ncbi:MAG: hypothetical protein COA85_13225 [Robiginitomaculum sp.]|nr:MAG: hypothetical protein COA85_13225 [Robiginitomaculum sp.]
MPEPEKNTEDYRPNIILFARHFPPHVSGGARRPYYLVKALQDLGCRVFVVAPALPDGIEGIAVPHVQPDPVTGIPLPPGLRDHLRDWLLWPDPDIRWTKRAIHAAQKAIPFQPDWVITTSPPESIHYAGQYFKNTTGCHWFADMRDHWLVRPFRRQRESTIRNFIERRIASKMLRQADLISTVNHAIAEEMHRYVCEPGKVFVLPHFSILEESIAPDDEITLPANKVNLVYTGSFSLSDPDCNIGDTLDVFARATAQNQALHLHIAGRLSAAEEEQIQASNCADKITLYGVLSLQQSHALQNAAHALVLAGSAHALTPPGKAAEYAVRAKPIVAITEAQWAMLYNGEKTAVEHMVTLSADTHALSTHVPFTQEETATEILQKMRAFSKMPRGGPHDR